MFENNKVTNLLNIKYPIIQAGMVWCSGWKLASSVSNEGCLGVIGAGSMKPDLLLEHLIKCNNATQNPFAVNLPLLYSDIESQIKHIVNQGVKIVITSAGNPKTWTKTFQNEGIKVIHVVPSTKFALKAVDAGVDAIVCEGFEAGGHNGREEITTFCLIPQIASQINIPIIAAGGISSGKSMLAAMILGADAVQIGTRFVVAKESSAHENFKNLIVNSKEDDTVLTLKQLNPVRLIKNEFYNKVLELEKKCASKEEIQEILGKGRAKKGIFEGDLIEGELEIGQISGAISKIESSKEIIEDILNEFEIEIQKIKHFS